MKKRHVLVLRNLVSQKYQFAALSIIVTLGVAIFISLTVAFHNMGSSYQRTYRELGFADFTVEVRQAPQDIVEDVRRLEGVADAEARLVLDTGLPLSESDLVHARLIGLPQDRRPTVNNVLVQSGTYWNPGARGVLLAESRFARFHDLKAGARLTFVTPTGEQELSVLGEASSPEYLINAASQMDIMPSPRRFGVFFLPLPQLQGLFGMEGQVNSIAVAVAGQKQREAAIEAVESLLQPYGVVQTVRQEDQPSNAALQMDLEGSKEFAGLLPALVLAIAALSIFIALSRMVQAQRQHVGLFMALGYSRGHVLRHYLTYAVVIALAGSALGIALGLWLASLLTDVYAETMGIPLVQRQFQPVPLVQAVAISVAVALAAGLAPAWRSARMQPSQAMRLDPQMALVRGGIPLVERALRLLFTPPLTLRIPLRAIFRTRARTLYTVAGVSFAIVLLLTAAANYDSMFYLLDVQFRQVERWDVDANLRPTTNAALLEEVSSWPEVRAVEPTIEGFGTLRYRGHSMDVMLLAIPADGDLHRFRMPGGNEGALGNGRAVLTPYVSQQTGAGRGDTVTLSTPMGEESFVVTGVSQEALGNGVYLALEEAQGLLGVPGMYNGMLITTAPGSAEGLKARLYRLPGMESVTLKETTLEEYNELMGLFYAMAGILLAFALIMAFAILFNTVTVNVLERQRELATMRTLGAGRTRLALMMGVESLLVGIGSLVPGMLLGTAVAYYITMSFSSELFNMLFYIAPRSYIAVAVGVLLTVALSVLPAVRRVNRMDLAEATKVLT